ncbi:MAG: hypothetical protein EA361_03585 [Bacteroidetes bacterium]|nr:MAG: hypothetical protein EA361_03585 [Bacteroidota bacterium]
MYQKVFFVFLVGITLQMHSAVQASGFDVPRESAHKYSVELCPFSPLFNIWAVQLAGEFSPRNEWMLGVAYMNIQYDSGRSHAPGLIVGYRRFLWQGAHLEYQLWPAWNAFYEKNEQQYYKGLELWNEFRAGYVWDFRVGNQTFSLIPQVLAGFGLLPGNKPESFIQEIENDRVFVAPILFVGYKF